MNPILEGSKIVLIDKETCHDYNGSYRHDIRYLESKQIMDNPFYLLAKIDHVGATHTDFVVYIHERPGICNNIDWLADRLTTSRQRFTSFIEKDIPWEEADEVERIFKEGSVMVIASFFFKEVDTNTQAKVLLKTEVD